MKTVFRLDSSIRSEGSVTRSVASSIEAALAANIDIRVIRREVGLTPIPSTIWAAAAFAERVAVEMRSPAQAEATALASSLAD